MVRVQKVDGCWVRRTDRGPNNFHEDIGPCARREPTWSTDRVARLVQECMAEADYRWESEALTAWNKGQPLPQQQPQSTVMRSCMNDASTTLVMENEGLKERLSELTTERDALRAREEQELAHHRSAEDEMTRSLGEAAKKPAPNAYATSTSSGTANTQAEQSGPPASSTAVNVSTDTAVPPFPKVSPPGAAPPPLKKAKPGARPPEALPLAPSCANEPGGLCPSTR
jgi:hypothetical protein